MKDINIPYVKTFDASGVITNPIKRSYINFYPNRQQRRAHLNEPRSFNNRGKKNSFTLFGNGTAIAKYKRVVQHIIVTTDKSLQAMAKKFTRNAGNIIDGNVVRTKVRTIYNYILMNDSGKRDRQNKQDNSKNSNGI